MPELRKFMSVRELAKYLQVHMQTIYHMARDGRLPARKVGAQWRFRRDEIDKWLNHGSRKG